jgi:hypothetical protein
MDGRRTFRFYLSGIQLASTRGLTLTFYPRTMSQCSRFYDHETMRCADLYSITDGADIASMKFRTGIMDRYHIFRPCV